jgi:hypothetical protein
MPDAASNINCVYYYIWKVIVVWFRLKAKTFYDNPACFFSSRLLYIDFFSSLANKILFIVIVMSLMAVTLARATYASPLFEQDQFIGECF